jgi:hypothetical protein
MRVQRDRFGRRRRPASKAARVRKYDELHGLRIHDDLGGLNVGDSLWRRLISLNCHRFLSHFRVGWGDCGDGADRTPRSDLLII